MLFKSRVIAGKAVSGKASFTIYGRDRFERNIRLLLSPEIILFPDQIVRIDCRFDYKTRPDQMNSENEIRLEHQLRLSRLKTRSYVGFVDDDNGQKYVSLFNRTSISLEKYGTWEIWLNLDKLNIGTSQNDYFYGYIMEKFNLSNSLELAAKYSYRYSRWYTDRQQSTLMLEMKALW
jgi:hypothetical protein